MNNFVNLCKQEDYSIPKLEEFVADSISKLGVKGIKEGITVLIKANLPDDCRVNDANSTHPNLVAAVANVLSNMGAKCIVADSPYGNFNETTMDKVYFSTGMLEVANTTKCVLNEDLSTISMPIPNGVRTRSLLMLGLVEKVDAIVNVGKLKIDAQLGYCGALTNLFGLLPGNSKKLILNRQNSLKDFYNLVIDLHEAIAPKIVLNIVDGVVALAAGGTPNLMSVLGASVNAYALDAQMLNILGIEINNSIIKPAIERGLVQENNLFRTMGENENFSNADFELPELALENTLKDGISNHAYFNLTQQRVCIPCKKCKGCGVCSEACPANAINMRFDKNGELFAEVDYKKCIYCNMCFIKCPYKVIRMRTPAGYKQLIKKLEKYNKE